MEITTVLHLNTNIGEVYVNDSLHFPLNAYSASFL